MQNLPITLDLINEPININLCYQSESKTTQNVQQTVEPTQPSTSNAAWISDLEDSTHEINPSFSFQLDKKRKLDDDDPMLGGVHNKQPRFQSSPQTSNRLRVPVENQQQINEYENVLDEKTYDDLAHGQHEKEVLLDEQIRKSRAKEENIIKDNDLETAAKCWDSLACKSKK